MTDDLASGIQPQGTSLRQLLEGLNPHDHLCLIYESPQERIAVAVPFLAIGLKRGEKCTYIVDTTAADEIRSHLKEEGVDVAAAERTGQLSILHESKAYTRGGFFDPDAMVAFLVEEMEKALAQGYPALRVTGEMSWVLRNLPGSEKLLEYEAKLNRDFFPNYPALAICQYDRWKFDAEIIKGVVMTHPLLIRGNRVYQNFYYVPPEDYLGGKLAEVEVRHWLNNLEREQRTQTELRQSEERYRVLTENSPLGVLVVVPGFRIVYANPAMTEITGYSVAELLSLPPEKVQALVHPQDRAMVWGRFQQRLAGEDVPPHYEFCGIRKDGKVRWLEMYATRIEYNGAPAVLAAMLDVTQRKRLEKALQDSETRYRRLFEAALDGILILDGDSGEIIDANPFLSYRLGYNLEELQGKHLWELGFIEDVEKSKATFEELKRKGYVRYEHLPLRTKEGRRIDAEFVCNEYEAGGRKFFQCNIRDITERKKLEEELRRSEERFRTVLEEVDEGYYETDLRGNFTFVTDAISRQLGYSKEELIGMNYRKYIPEEEWDAVFKAFNGVYRTGQPLKRFSVTNITKDGRRIFVEDTVLVRRDEKGEIVGFRGVSRDVTERKQLEEALKASEQEKSIILSTVQELILRQDLRHKVLWANRAAAQSVNSTPEQLVGRHCYQIWHGRSTPCTGCPVAKARETGEPQEGEMSTPDGRIWLVHGYPVKDASGKVTELIEVTLEITERKRSQEMYETILRTTIDGFWLADMEGRFLEVNDAYCRLTGYSREELLRMTIRDVEAIETPEETSRRIQKIQQVGYDRFESRHRCKDGRVVDVEVSVSYLPGDTGRMVVFVRDITERKKAEEALRQSEERYRTLVENAAEAIAVMQDGIIKFANAKVVEITGYTMEELNSMPRAAVVHPDDRDRVIGYHERRLRGEEAPTDYEFRIIDKQGNLKWLERRVALITWEGRPAVLVLDTDITERKRAEEQLKMSEQRYRTVLEEADEGYFETDLGGNMTFCSEAIARTLGYSKEELCGMNYRQLFPKEEWEVNFEVFNKVFRTGEPVRWFPGTAITKDRRRIAIERTVLPLRNEKGEIVGFRGVARDVTERKRAEEERKQLELKAQMASRLASVGEMAAGIAHEINNPLTGVIGYAQLLMSRQDLPEDVRQNLKVIADAAQRVAGIVQRLLAFSRQTKPERRQVNINQLIESTLALRAYSLRTSNIEVITRLDPYLPDTIADPGQIQQVLLNLIVNAEQAMKEVRRRGRLTITTKKKGDVIEIKVKDNGHGIKPEIMNRIFDPFFTTREAGGGTGLGLSLCYGIVTEHNGRIYARSTPGRGATFIVELPIVTEVTKPVQPPIALKQELAGTRILVVDDEPVVRELVSKVLGDEGCEVDTAAKAEEALEKIEGQRYHLVLIDVKMPGMSGIELFQRMQRTARSLARRAVFITGDVLSPETERFLAGKKLPCLAKPFTATELLDKVRIALAGRR